MHSRLIRLAALSSCAVLPLPGAWELDFSDDFSGDLSQWEQVGCAVIEDESLFICTSHDTIRQAEGFGPWEDFRYEADMLIETVAAGIVVRRRDDGNYLMLQFHAGSGLFRPHLRQAGSWSVLAEIPAPILLGSWQNVVIESVGGQVTTWLDGEEVYTFYHDFPARGGIGFRTGSSESFRMDNLVVSQGEPEPPAPPQPPSTPVGLYAAPLHDGAAGIHVGWDAAGEPPDRWELLLTHGGGEEADRRLLVPGLRTAAWVPVPEGSGQWDISLRAWEDGLSSEWTMAASLPGSVPPPGFEKWIREALPQGLPPHAYAPESNEDTDTLPALLEYAVGRSPVLGEYAPLLAFDPYDDSMPPVLTGPVVREDVEVLIQESEDLNRWVAVPPSTGTFMKPQAEPSKRFYRAAAESLQADWLEAQDLRVEHLRAMESADVDNPTPLLSWALRSGNRSTAQSAYHVLVASDRTLLESATGDVWDSGKQSGDRPNVRLPEGLLQSNRTYWWTVRLWNAADNAGGYAEPVSFQTGSLSVSAYAARPMQVQTPVKPVELRRNTSGNTFVDFGRAAFGTIRLRVPGADGGETVTVHLGEKKKADDTVDRSPGGTIRHVRTQVNLPPDGQWVTVVIPEYANWPSIADMPAVIGQVAPFRYVELEGLPGEVSADDIEQLAVHTPWDEEASAFRSSDNVLNQVWELCKYSIKATTFASVYVDGDRERLPYEADAYINQLAHYGCEPSYALARFTHEWLIDHPTWPTEWKHHSVLMAHADWLYTGDMASLERNYTKLKTKLFPGSERADQLINPGTRDIVDWPSGERDGYQFRDYNTVVNAFQYASLRCMADIAAVLGHATEAATFTERADVLRSSFNAVFWDPAQERYTDGEGTTHASLHANMWALAFGLVPEDRKQTVIDFIIGKGMACSVYGAHYLLEGLFDNGEAEAAIDLMRSTGMRSWFNMIRVGSTITLEAWDQAYKSNLDWNHAWGAAPAAAIPRWVLGVRPAEPGFRLLHIEPQLGPLEWIDGKVPTPHGPVEIMVTKAGEASLTASIKAPAGTRLRISLPVPEGASGALRINGESIEAATDDGRVLLPELPAGALLIEME